jgi:predicted Zn finger-like uncharacterized protein
MILTCPNCGTRYQADAAKFPAAGRKVKCAKCGESWHQDPPLPEPIAAVVAPEIIEQSEPEEQPVFRQPEPPEQEPEPEAPRVSAYVPPPTRTAVVIDAEEAPVRSRSVWPARLGVLFGWAILVAIVLAAGWAIVKYRQEVATAWPQTASLYAATGMPVNALGIDFRDVSYRREKQDGQFVLAVTGELVNISTREQPVLQLRAALSDNSGRELYHWTFSSGVTTLAPGQTQKFLTRISSPPAGAHHLEVRFAKSGE